MRVISELQQHDAPPAWPPVTSTPFHSAFSTPHDRTHISMIIFCIRQWQCMHHAYQILEASEYPNIRCECVISLCMQVKRRKIFIPHIWCVFFFLARKLGVVVVSHTHTHIVHARTISTLCLCLPLACSISLTCPVPTSSEMSPTKFAIPKIYSRASFTEGSDG